MTEIQEKMFQHFHQVPKNVRMRMINKMKIDERCRMTRCSKLTDQEVRSSKNFFIYLELKKNVQNSMKIRVLYIEENIHHGYYVRFTRTEPIQMSYYTLDNQFVWGMELKRFTDYDEFVIEQFRKTLRFYRNNINKLIFVFLRPQNSEMWMNLDFGIESLENLEDLCVHAPINVQQILSKIHHPLKTLAIAAEWNRVIPENYNQICRVERRLGWECVSLNYQQLLQLPANDIEISIGQLTERDIFNFIRSWQDGSLGREIISYGWFLPRNSNFDRRKLLRFLRVPNRETGCIEIKHFNIPGKSTYLRLEPDVLKFFTPMF